MYSRLMTSITEARSWRAPKARLISSSVRTGSTSAEGAPRGEPPSGTLLIGGNHPSCEKKTKISTAPIRNSGSALTASVEFDRTWSTAPPGRSPQATPTTPARGTKNSRTMPPRIREFEIAGHTTSATDTWLPWTRAAVDWPKSPSRKRPAKLR